MNDWINRFGYSTVYSALDVHWGYNQTQIIEDSEKTTFVTNFSAFSLL